MLYRSDMLKSKEAALGYSSEEWDKRIVVSLIIACYISSVAVCIVLSAVVCCQLGNDCL